MWSSVLVSPVFFCFLWCPLSNNVATSKISFELGRDPINDLIKLAVFTGDAFVNRENALCKYSLSVRVFSLSIASTANGGCLMLWWAVNLDSIGILTKQHPLVEWVELVVGRIDYRDSPSGLIAVGGPKLYSWFYWLLSLQKIRDDILQLSIKVFNAFVIYSSVWYVLFSWTSVRAKIWFHSSWAMNFQPGTHWYVIYGTMKAILTKMFHWMIRNLKEKNNTPQLQQTCRRMPRKRFTCHWSTTRRFSRIWNNTTDAFSSIKGLNSHCAEEVGSHFVRCSFRGCLISGRKFGCSLTQEKSILNVKYNLINFIVLLRTSS